MKRQWLIAAGVFLGITIVLELLDFFVLHSGHPHSWWHRTPIFDFLFGTLGCALIVVASKWLGHAWLQRAETYYGDEQ